MEIFQTAFPEVLLIRPAIYSDKRGFFLESHSQQKYAEAGIPHFFVQDNLCHSKKNVIRGLHYQLKKAQDKLIYVITGSIFDVIVDIRKGSPTFGKWVSQLISDENHFQLFIPRGFAHGYCVLSENTNVIYKCSEFYNPEYEFGIAWNDSMLDIDWPIKNPLLSEKDSHHKNLLDISFDCLPMFESVYVGEHNLQIV